MRTRLLPILLSLIAIPVVWLSPSSAAARSSVVILPFGGGGLATEIRDAMVRALGKKYQIIDGAELKAACDRLGVSMSRGKNLAMGASELGAVAVVGGTFKESHLLIAVYSGKTGQPLATGSVAFGGKITRPALGKALAMILKGLKKAPKKMRKPKFSPDTVAPVPELRESGGADGGGTGRDGGKAGGAPSNDGTSGSSGGSLSYDPNAHDGGGSGAPSHVAPTGEENPLAAPQPPLNPPPGATAKPPEGSQPPRIQATLGFGSWMRKFYMNDDAGTGQAAPKYDAAAVTLRADLRLYPAAFFVNNWASGILIHLQYQQALALASQSQQVDPNTATRVFKNYDTSMRELVFDAGYDWKMFKNDPLSPHLEVTVGYGLMDFAIAWDSQASPTLPDASYRFFIANAAFRYNFFSWLGARAGFNYRAVSGTGGIEEDQWYGPASTNGLGLLLGVYGSWKGFIARAQYDFTYYFYRFLDPVERQSQGKNAAGGALDFMHVITINVGYGF